MGQIISAWTELPWKRVVRAEPGWRVLLAFDQMTKFERLCAEEGITPKRVCDDYLLEDWDLMDLIQTPGEGEVTHAELETALSRPEGLPRRLTELGVSSAASYSCHTARIVGASYGRRFYFRPLNMKSKDRRLLTSALSGLLAYADVCERDSPELAYDLRELVSRHLVTGSGQT